MEKIVFKNTQAQTMTLLNELATDDNYRNSFEKDPRAALAKFNVILPADADITGTKLPSKAEMQKMQEGLINDNPLSSVSVSQTAGQRPKIDAHYAFFAFFLAMKGPEVTAK